MLYTVGYRGHTIWRTEPSSPFKISETDARDLETLQRKQLRCGTFHDFASARREIDYIKGFAHG